MRNKKLIVIFSIFCAAALLVILSSVVFSVQHINAYCYNADDEALETAVLDNCGIKNGKSIFALDKQTVIENVESKINNIRVINIEKKFPNRVYINYVKIERYLKVQSGGDYYYISNSGKIMKIDTIENDSINDPDDKLIELKFRGNVKSECVENDYLSSTDDNDILKINTILQSLERLLYRDEMLNLFEWIDFNKNFMYFKTRTGAYFELQSIDNCFGKLGIGISTYISLGASSAEVKSGTFILVGAKGEEKAQYNPKDRYTYGI